MLLQKQKNGNFFLKRGLLFKLPFIIYFINFFINEDTFDS